jgi:biopolymer transport protein ExbD
MPPRDRHARRCAFAAVAGLLALVAACGEPARPPRVVDVPCPSSTPPVIAPPAAAASASTPISSPHFPPPRVEEPGVLRVYVAADGRFGAQGAVVDLEGIGAMARSEHDRDPDVRAVIAADASVSHGTVMKVMDRLRAAGITRVAFAVGRN